MLHVSRYLPGDPKIKQGVNVVKSCTNSSASGSSAFGFNYISGDNGDVRVLINEPVSNLASNNLTSHPSISPTKNCTNSSALGSSAFNFISSSNEDDSGYQNVSKIFLDLSDFPFSVFDLTPLSGSHTKVSLKKKKQKNSRHTFPRTTQYLSKQKHLVLQNDLT